MIAANSAVTGLLATAKVPIPVTNEESDDRMSAPWHRAAT
jgi:hypothetical protein